jgi:hypothetical protein
LIAFKTISKIVFRLENKHRKENYYLEEKEENSFSNKIGFNKNNFGVQKYA